MADQTTPQDPTVQYEQPDTDGEQIDHPGRTADMGTEPDHGEDTYQGSDRLKGKRAVITGGDSGIGRAVAVAFAREGGSIIITSSVQAVTPSPELIDYAMTKAALVSLTKSLAQVVAEKGVRVNAVAPGPIWTSLIPATMAEEKVATFGESTPLGHR